MPCPNASYRDPINILDAAVRLFAWMLWIIPLRWNRDICLNCPERVYRVGQWESWKHENTAGWFFTKQNMFSVRALLTEAASTGAASHWSPAVQHWSLCVFWCTGPECDVISLLRQKRQARSPPSGHRPLTWTAALYAIITERHRQAELSCLWKVLIEQGETLASGARTGTRIGGGGKTPERPGQDKQEQVLH